MPELSGGRQCKTRPFLWWMTARVVLAAAAMPGMSGAGTIAMFPGVETTDLAVAYLTSRFRELGFFVLCASRVPLFELPNLQTSRCHEFLNSIPLPI